MITEMVRNTRYECATPGNVSHRFLNCAPSITNNTEHRNSCIVHRATLSPYPLNRLSLDCKRSSQSAARERPASRKERERERGLEGAVLRLPDTLSKGCSANPRRKQGKGNRNAHGSVCGTSTGGSRVRLRGTRTPEYATAPQIG